MHLKRAVLDIALCQLVSEIDRTCAVQHAAKRVNSAIVEIIDVLKEAAFIIWCCGVLGAHRRSKCRLDFVTCTKAELTHLNNHGN